MWQKGIWYKYNDVDDLPREIEENCQPLSFNSSHGSSSQTQPGGKLVMIDMFEVLAKFEDCKRQNGKLLNAKDEKKVEEALAKAIIIFAEALRFLSVYLAVRARIKKDEAKSELDPSLWKLILVWGHCSADVLGLPDDLPALDTDAPKHLLNKQVRRPTLAEPVTLATLDDAIGSAGEIMFLKAREDLIMSADEMAKVQEMIIKRKVPPRPEPGFQDIAVDVDLIWSSLSLSS